MAALDFPASPTVGQAFTAGNGVTYTWTGTVWLASGASAGGDFMATNSAAFNMPTTISAITLNTVKTGNSPVAYYSTSTGRYTPPPGRYAISVSIYGSNVGVGTHISVALYKNGVMFAEAYDTTAVAGYYGNAVINTIIDANGSDYFQIWGLTSAGSGGAFNAFFTAYPISGIKGPPGDATPGTLIQTVSYQTGAVATGTTVLPDDDTIPQIGEGNEYMTLAITPRSATSKLIIDVLWNGSHNIASTPALVVALFQDSTANALAAVRVASTQYVGCNIRLTHSMTSGTTSATTFKVRVGASAAGTTTFNGGNSTRNLGGVMASSIVIQEVSP